jgi:ribokinase
VRLELSPVQTPSIRNWALYEGADVRRFIPWLTSGKHLDQSLLPSELPREVCHARVCHVAPMPLSVQTQLVRSLHAGECVVSLDPHDEYLPGHEKDILDLLPMLTIFLPSRQEARLIFGGDQPEAAARAFAAAGSRIVVIKLGPEGSLVCDGASTAVHHVPAFETTVRDPTGAGDAYCGAFAVTFARIGDALAAARHASVAASFVVERLGAASVLPVNRAEAERRLRVLAPELEGATST